MEMLQTAIGIVVGGVVVAVAGIVIWRDLRPRRSAGQQIDAQQRELNEHHGQTRLDREFSAYDRDRGIGS